MKTVEEPSLKADPVIAEVRRAKVALAQNYDFDVIAMVRGLREQDRQDDANPTRLDNPPPAPSPDPALD